MKILTKKELIENSIHKLLSSKGRIAHEAISTAISTITVDPDKTGNAAFAKDVSVRQTVPMKDRLLIRQLYVLYGWDIVFYGSEETNPCQMTIQVGNWKPL